MHYDFVAIPDAEIPPVAEPAFRHVIATYVSEANKTASVWRAVPEDRLDFTPHPKTNPIRAIFIHELRSQHHFFGRLLGTEEPPAEVLPLAGEKLTVTDYLDKFVWLVKRRLPQLAAGTSSWWLEERDFFEGLKRERVWVFWRSVLHACHHRTQVQTWLRLAGCRVPGIYGPSGDEA